jgi:hypothetical protein
MKEIIMALMIWIGANTNYNVDVLEPKILFVTQDQLEQAYYGGEKYEGVTLHGFYDTKLNLIILPDTWDRTDSWNQSVLLHEMIHYLQDVNQIKYPCIEEMEKDTWPLQKQYLKEQHNFDWDYDKLWHLLISSCPSAGPYG